MKTVIYFLILLSLISESFGALTRMRLQEKTRKELSKGSKDAFDKHLKKMDKLKKLNDELHGRKHVKDDKNEEVKHAPLENAAMFQGDMILSEGHADALINEAKIKLEAKKQGKNTNDKSVVDRLKKNRAFMKSHLFRWEFPIPYFVEPEVDQNKIDVALKDIENNTCVRFQKSDKFQDKSGLRYYMGPGCFSFGGRVKDDSPQDVSIGKECDRMGIVGHETMHALGFFHEQSRYDRDQYLKIDFNNIEPNMKFNFDVIGDDKSDTFGVSFNYGSAMQYGRLTFSKGKGNTMIPKNELYLDSIGNSNRLQFLDYKQINIAYCKDKCKGEVQCANGGYENPNQCGTCLCPYLLTGKTCTEYIKNPPACGDQNVIKLSGSPVTVKPKGAIECVYAVSSEGKVKVSIDNAKLYSKFVYCSTSEGLEVQYLNDKTLTGPAFCGNAKGKTVTSEGNLMLVKYSGLSNDHFADLTFTAV
uniref:Zinc metalloproteinase n=1 Tax=Parastrongyloides trichosuri TaxID=131310 RepID=A0A0N4Z1H3_PARTI